MRWLHVSTQKQKDPLPGRWSVLPGLSVKLITIRHERSEDHEPIRLLLEQAFGGSDEADLVDTLRTRGACALSLVAILDKQVTGHIFFSPVTIESKRSNFSAVGLGPMAVLPTYQRKGIGAQLVRTGLEQCLQAGYEIVVVVGHPHFYPRFGFLPGRLHGIQCEFDVPDEAFMVMELREGVLARCRGIARYQPEFRAV